MWICINSLKTKEEAEKIMKQQHTKTSRADSCTSHALCVWLILFALPSLFLTRACLVSLLVSLSSIRKLILLGGIFKKWFSFATIKTHTMQPNLSLIHAHASALNTDIIARRTYDFFIVHVKRSTFRSQCYDAYDDVDRWNIYQNNNCLSYSLLSTPLYYSTSCVCVRSLLASNGIFFAL